MRRSFNILNRPVDKFYYVFHLKYVKEVRYTEYLTSNPSPNSFIFMYSQLLFFYVPNIIPYQLKINPLIFMRQHSTVISFPYIACSVKFTLNLTGFVASKEISNKIAEVGNRIRKSDYETHRTSHFQSNNSMCLTPANYIG